MWEETGLKTERLTSVGYEYAFPLAEKWRYAYAEDVTEIREFVFVAEVGAAAQPRLDPTEHDDWRWCALEEAVGMLQWPENIDALRHVDAWLDRASHSRSTSAPS